MPFCRSITLFLFLLAFGASAAFAEEKIQRRGPWGDPGSTLEMAKRMDAESFAKLEQTEALIEETSDRKSFVVWHAPELFDPKTGVVLVTLHGHQSWASKSAIVWQDEVRSRGWAQGNRI